MAIFAVNHSLCDLRCDLAEKLFRFEAAAPETRFSARSQCTSQDGISADAPEERSKKMLNFTRQKHQSDRLSLAIVFLGECYETSTTIHGNVHMEKSVGGGAPCAIRNSN